MQKSKFGAVAAVVSLLGVAFAAAPAAAGGCGYNGCGGEVIVVRPQPIFPSCGCGAASYGYGGYGYGSYGGYGYGRYDGYGGYGYPEYGYRGYGYRAMATEASATEASATEASATEAFIAASIGQPSTAVIVSGGGANI